MKASYQPHDNLFRKFLSNSQVAKDFLSHRLPSAVLKKVDLNTLQYEDPGKVSPRLKSSYFDVLLSLSLKSLNNKIYVAIEHQTKEDPHMLGRLFKNLLKLWSCVVDGKKAYMPLPFGLVVYSGKRPYKGMRMLTKAFGDEELAMGCPGLSYVIVLNEESFEEIMKDGSVGLLTALLREGGRDFCSLVDRHSAWLGKELEKCSEDELEAVSVYMLGLDNHPDKLREKLSKFGRQIERKMVNAALILERRGEKRGIQIGEERGIQLGREQERIETARKLLSMKMSKRTIAQATDLSEHEIAALKPV